MEKKLTTAAKKNQTSELENDSESVWVKVFTIKTSHFVASWYQPPGRNLAELTSEIGLLKSQLQKIKCMHKGNNHPHPSVHVLWDFNFGDIVWPDRLNKSGSPLSTSEGETLIKIMNDYGLEQLLEHIVCSNIMAHLDEHRLWSEKQHAFRKWHSCDDWAKILDNQGQVDTFILDFEKAFDTPLMNFSKARCLAMELEEKL